MNYIAARLEKGRPVKGWQNWISVVFLPLTLLPALMLMFVQTINAQAYHIQQRSVDIVSGCARLKPDLFAAGANPAVLGITPAARLAVSKENAWSLPETGFSRLMAELPAGNGAIGLGVEQSGKAGYRESEFSFGYGLSLGKGSMGLLLNYRRFQAAGYQPVSSGAALLGFRIPLFPDVLTGISFSVPFDLRRGRNHADKPAGDYRFELGFLASAQVSLFAAWAKTDGLTAAAEFGVDYAFAEHFFFVAGLHGRTGAPFGKAGWAKYGWRLVIFTCYQAPLGFSPGLGLSWDRPEKKHGTEQSKREKP